MSAMFGSIGGPELILIFLVALLIFGPRKLPELGKMLGKGMGEFRRAANDLKVSLETEVEREAAARPLPAAPAGSPDAPEAGPSPGAATGTPESSGGSLTPAPAPGAVSRPRRALPGMPEPEAEDAAPAAAPTPAAPDADGREIDGPR